ncbi:hypothetical protein [Pararhodobacter sp. SW119]|uniref:hypothetical protein n=1 Tax=Pararhodobacter sp. SW119 TaxID=2780075 RepID=UPI001AE01F02|nr:hypothetical protein [Pararhodobacter sp. SW119]
MRQRIACKRPLPRFPTLPQDLLSMGARHLDASLETYRIIGQRVSSRIFSSCSFALPVGWHDGFISGSLPPLLRAQLQGLLSLRARHLEASLQLLGIIGERVVSRMISGRLMGPFWRVLNHGSTAIILRAILTRSSSLSSAPESAKITLGAMVNKSK